MKKAKMFLIFSLLFLSSFSWAWGFYAHKKIIRIAVFSLPVEMIKFYKHNLDFLEENTVNPDKRRYINPLEAPRHYIDIDAYGDSALYHLPRYYPQALKVHGEDTLLKYGIVPWHVQRVFNWLTLAFKNEDVEEILRLSADLAHYIADANVPLHTTQNYNGQLTNQKGTHALWETRLPELFSHQYNFFVGKATYIPNTQLHIWQGVIHAHHALDSVLNFEKSLTEKWGVSNKYTIEERGQTHVKNYSELFSEAYHQKLNGMVERRMRASIKMIADFWFSAWVNGGQPNLDVMINKK